MKKITMHFHLYKCKPILSPLAKSTKTRRQQQWGFRDSQFGSQCFSVRTLNWNNYRPPTMNYTTVSLTVCVREMRKQNSPTAQTVNPLHPQNISPTYLC